MPSSDLLFGILGPPRRAAYLRGLVWFHRWAGVLLCLEFALWFASGAVLIFVPFPSLSDTDRLAHAEPIPVMTLTVAPADLVERGFTAHDFRIIEIAGRPVYLGAGPDGTLTAIYGDDGTVAPAFDINTVRRIASVFAAAPISQIDGPRDYDQWTVHQRFDPYRPLYRVAYDDVEHSEIYISARSGEVVQRTTRSQRTWNWCGSVLHWIYFTPIRANWSLWNQLVWWLSLAAVFVAVAGFWLGILRFLQQSRSIRGGITPYRQWLLAWHHILGLLFGLALLGWIVSGWLSMDHGRLFSKGQASEGEIAALRGMTQAELLRAVSLDQLRGLGPASEIRFTALAGQAVIVTRGVGQPRLFMAGQDQTAALDRLPDRLMAEAIGAAWPGNPIQSRTDVAADDLYALAEGLSAGTRLFQLTGKKVYLDPVLGRVTTVMDGSREAYAWVYYALHTFNFPGLASRPLLRQTLLILLSLGGFALSLTSVAVAARRLRRSVR